MAEKETRGQGNQEVAENKVPTAAFSERKIFIAQGKGAERFAERMRATDPDELQRLLEQREKYEPPKLIDAVRDGFRRVSRDLIGREDTLNQTFLALLTREHQLIYSKAGTAKTLLASSVFNQFDNARVFSIQFTKGTPEEAVVGGVDLTELKNGRVKHNTRGTIVDARLAFLDELFDANDVTLRSILGILNERWFKKGSQEERALMHTAIAATNYIRSTDVTEAVIDRFAFRSFIIPNQNAYDLLRIDKAYAESVGKVRQPNKKIPFDYIDYLADIVEGEIEGREIKSPPHVLFLKNEIIREYLDLINTDRKANDKPELYLSPRTIAKARDVLNASALLHNRQETTIEDLNALKYMICTLGSPDEDQVKVFENAKRNVKGSVNRHDLETVDTLINTNDVLEQIIEAKETGIPLDLRLLDRIKLFLGITSLSELTFSQIVQVVNRARPSNPRVAEIQKGIASRMAIEAQRFASTGTNNPNLF